MTSPVARSAESRSVTWRPSPFAISFASIVVATGIAGLFGLPCWIVISLSSAPWLLFLRERWGGSIAFVAIVIVNLWAILGVMMGTTMTHLPITPTVIVLWGLTGLAGVVKLDRQVRGLPSPIRARSVWFSALVGPVIWLGSIALSSFVPGAARYLWVMSNDMANNLLFAREIIYRGGIGVGFNENPVPLPAAVLALAMSSGRTSVPSETLLRHDIGAFVQVWALLIALLCFVTGVLTAQIVRLTVDRPLIVATVGIAGSMVPLSWFFTSYPLDYGFVSTHFALVIVLGCVLVSIRPGPHQRVVFALLCLSATCLLAVWSPLVLIPAMIAAALIVTHRRAFLPLTGRAAFAPWFGLIQVAAYGIGVALPGFLSLRAFLKAPGGVFAFPHWMLPVLAVIAVLLAGLALWRNHKAELVTIVGVAAGALLGLGGLLFFTRNAPDPWTYYPTKYAWIASAALLVSIIGLLPAAVAALSQRSAVRMTAVAVVVAACAGIVVAAPPSDELHSWEQPIAWILSGNVVGTGDEVAEKIITTADLEHPAIYWQSGEKHQLFINFWLLEVAANSMTKSNALRVASYGGYHEEKILDLCSLMTTLGGSVRVYTANNGLESQIASACPTLGARVIVNR